MISLALVAALAAGATEQLATAAEERCAVIYSDLAGETRQAVIPELHIVGADAAEFRVPGIDNGKVSAIMCGRKTLVPSSSDWVVVNAGLPLSISVGDRVLVLEIDSRKLQARMIKGEMTPAEIPLVKSRLDELANHMNAFSEEPSGALTK